MRGCAGRSSVPGHGGRAGGKRHPGGVYQLTLKNKFGVEVGQIVNIVIGFIGGGGLITILFLNLNKRQKKAEVRKIEIDVEQIEDEVQRKRIIATLEDLEEIHNELAQVRKQLLETEQKLMDTELALIEMTSEAKIAKKWRCESLTCLERIPPLHTSDSIL